ncbi:hypothetical protein [Streptomyces profundus]|uniref:hypothetical protein n=1 Tax=Streptomyces profundus TaxID=2867410 RepID=UPI001D15FB04|nr:hypothetical protein [Streptomyces sp. MA3_2.13]UED84572.1 hypothetical protein K4G22_10455 [Streptomyces sp. MA3_2.13]
MRRLNGSRVGRCLASAAALTLLCAGSAVAAPGDKEEGGAREGQEVVARARAEAVVFEERGNGGGGPLTSTSRNWSPPPCWYAPTWSPEQLRDLADAAWDPTGQTGHAAAALGWMWNHYEQGEPYTDFNAEEAENGMWWGPVQNPAEPDLLERLSCTHIPFWVETGEIPEVENALSPEVLAELAYQRIRVPDTEIRLNPAAVDGQIVNLATWIWADGGAYDEVSVTARLESWDIWATTTARPTALRIDPGTEDARSHPPSGSCPIGGDGSVGAPFVRGTDEGAEPPCGLTYLRATHDGRPYSLTASVTWAISWQGSGDTGATLPDATFATTHELQVDEIQSIVRP